MSHAWWAAALAAVTLFPSLVAAQVYRWVDDQGTLHYSTDLERVPERYRPEARELSVPRGPSEAADPQAPPPSAGPITVPFAPGAPIVVEARLNGAGPVRLILDTGADRTMVAPAVLDRLAITSQGALPARIKGVTGTSVAAVVQVESVEVGGVSVGPLAIVAHDADLGQADGLLGRDVLAWFTVTIDASASVATLRPR